MFSFFVPPEQINQDLITITGPDVHHLVRVLRLQTGDLIRVVDGTGQEYLAELEQAAIPVVTARIRENIDCQREPDLNIILLQGVVKGEKFDFIVQKCTEIGVRKIIPVICERTVVHLTEDKSEKRCRRWQRIAAESAKQCRRSLIPEVDPVLTLKTALDKLPPMTTLIMPWEEESQGIKSVLKGPGVSGPVAILIGPEGGFTNQEADLVRKYGGRTVSLGPRILRTETAAMVTLALVLFAWGDLGGRFVE